MPCLAASVSPEALAPAVEERLRAYAGLLATWTRRINLVSAGDLAVFWDRHVVDSLRLVPLLPGGVRRGIDLGSGAGLPGLVLAIATGVAFDLVEADRRKAAFLREAARVTGAPARVHDVRIEACGCEPAQVVTARALAPLARLLPLAAPLLAPGGVMLFPKGAGAAVEVEEARAAWSFELEVVGGAGSPVLCVCNPRARVGADG